MGGKVFKGFVFDREDVERCPECGQPKDEIIEDEFDHHRRLIPEDVVLEEFGDKAEKNGETE